jgi:hypothetical protein
MTLQHRFVEYIPDQLEEGILYISIKYCTAIHKCVCGCGNEVVTPISPTGWQLTFNGESVTLNPSIGNWNFDCKTHYWIVENKVRIARKWPDWEIEARRNSDSHKKKNHFNKRKGKI